MEWGWVDMMLQHSCLSICNIYSSPRMEWREEELSVLKECGREEREGIDGADKGLFQC